jgi:hypothetical protein
LAALWDPCSLGRTVGGASEGTLIGALLDTLSSPAVLTRRQDDCRLYGNGLSKLEPSELKQVRFPIARRALER